VERHQVKWRTIAPRHAFCSISPFGMCMRWHLRNTALVYFCSHRVLRSAPFCLVDSRMPAPGRHIRTDGQNNLDLGEPRESAQSCTSVKVKRAVRLSHSPSRMTRKVCRKLDLGFLHPPSATR
jgi:hypothetical protein